MGNSKHKNASAIVFNSHQTVETAVSFQAGGGAVKLILCPRVGWVKVSFQACRQRGGSSG